MYTATFVFKEGTFDDDFHALDNTIADVAKTLPGYVGEESWHNAESGLVSNVYYWESLEALQALIQHPAHILAKQQQSRWLDGYDVVISQVLRHYGDGRLGHLAQQSGPDKNILPTKDST